MDLFETETLINENTLLEIKKYLPPRSQRISQTIFIILLTLMLIHAVVRELYGLMVFLIVAIFYLVWRYFFIQKRYVKVNMLRLEETISAKECLYTTSLTDKGYKSFNHATNGVATISYDDFYRFVKTEHYYLLFTKANQFVIMNRKTIDDANKAEELFDVIRQRCKNIKQYRL